MTSWEISDLSRNLWLLRKVFFFFFANVRCLCYLLPRSSMRRKPVPFDDLQALSKREPSSLTPIGVDFAPDVFTRLFEGDFQEGNKGAPGGTPNHVLVMQERQKLGSSATMARGAFMFSLVGLCTDLKRKRKNSLG